MSRIAKAPISVPSGVEVQLVGRVLRVKGPKGEASFNCLPGVELVQTKEALQVRTLGGANISKRTVAMSGTMRALTHNLIVGVSEGFEKRLSIVGVGYRAQASGQKLQLSLGFSHPVEYQVPQGVSVETPTQTEIVVRGTDKQKVGQVAAEIRSFRPPEPYKGKGVRYQDEQVRRKQAKKK